MKITLFILLFILVSAPVSAGVGSDSEGVQVNYDQCDAVLRILEKRTLGRSVSTHDWEILHNTEAYRLIKRRAEQRQMEISDGVFESFVLSDTLAEYYPDLTRSRANLEHMDIAKALTSIMRYLPEGTSVAPKVYVILKPVFNSFVYGNDLGQLVIFLSLYPGASSGLFENKLTHELFHIGFGQSLRAFYSTLDNTWSRSANRIKLIQTITPLQEGIAMLVAAGGWQAHPHAQGKESDRARWDATMQTCDSDLKSIDQFILDVMSDKLRPEEIDRIDSTFSGYQGPWYTVGWKMSALIESTMGRDQLAKCIKDFTLFIPTYNRAASIVNRARGESHPLYSSTIVDWLQ